MDRDIKNIYKLLKTWGLSDRKLLVNRVINLKMEVKRFRRENEIEKITEEFLEKKLNQITRSSGKLVENDHFSPVKDKDYS